MRAILRALAATYPEAVTALHFRTPFQLLVATILSAQSTDARVNVVTGPLFRDHPTPASLARLRPVQLERYIRSCGLFRTKARAIVAAARTIETEHGGEVPADREALQRLPGVGRKTASVVLSSGFGIPAIAVDTHVGRVARRLGLAQGTTPEQVEMELMAIVPRAEWGATHHRLIAHGRQICQARRPRCEVCPLTRWCDYWQALHPA
ncbi:MAG: endonuclease III [Gemmatimonadota bacterium]